MLSRFSVISIMTIAIAVTTASAAVFAADSKVTVRGLAGLEENGAQRWVNQTYDNAVKVVHDTSKTAMALFAGHVNIGQLSAIDFFMSSDLTDAYSANQEHVIERLVQNMNEKKREFWAQTDVEPANWPGPSVLVAAPAPGRASPRIWRIRLWGETGTFEEVLTNPGIMLEGSYNEVFGLLYGYHPEVLEGFADALNVKKDEVWAASQNLKVLRPLDKMNLWTMPIQDAIDLAVLLAKLQVQMDRFLPGEPACGGPIDVMVLQTSPSHAILTFPGKTLRHPDL